MRNKFTTAILALALALTTITSATAMPVEQTTDTDTEPTVTVQNKDDGIAVHDAGSNVYEVALKWDDPTFTFVPKQQIEKVWNAETHHYEYTSSVEDFVITDGEWDKTTATATVTNDSSVPMTVSSSLFAAADSTSAVQSYKLSSESDLAISLSGSEEAIIKNAGTKTVTCSLSGSDVAGYFAATGATTAVTGRWIFTFEMSEPIMAEKDTWYKGATAKSTISSINVVSSYQPTGNETESWDASAAGDGSVMAYLNGTELTIAGNDSGMVFMNPNAYSAFANFTALTTVTNADIFDTSRTTSMAGLFNNCKALTTVNGLEKWDTSLVTSMSGLFLYCGELTSVDLTNWKTPSLQHMSHMFLDNMKLTSVGDLSGWDTSNVLEMTNMFYRCFALTGTGDISEWDTSKVTNMSRMFAMIGNNSGLSELDLSGWDTSSVTNVTSMFLGCEKLEVLNMANWDTTNVTKHDTKFNNVPLLREVTLGPKYTLVAELPSPSGDGSDGKWHDTVSGEAYTVEELANVTRTEAVTYTAFPDLTGTWLWNETVEMPDYTAEDTLLPLNGTAEIPVKFTSNGGKQYETVNLRSIPFTMNYGMADGTSDDAYAQLRTNKWSNSAMRVFSFSEPFKYSSNHAFYSWFIKNAQPAPALTGSWVFNETLNTTDPPASTSFSFTSNGNTFSKMGCAYDGTGVQEPERYYPLYYDGLTKVASAGGTAVWYDASYRYITFNEPFECSISPEFYVWFTANAKPASEYAPLSGQYIFNETLNRISAMVEMSEDVSISYSVGGIEKTKLYVTYYFSGKLSGLTLHYTRAEWAHEGSAEYCTPNSGTDTYLGFDGWRYEERRVIDITTPFYIDENPLFYLWFIKNAEVANPLSDTWVWNESLDSKTPFCTADNQNIPASFSCNQIEYSNFYFEKPVSSLLIISYGDSGATSLRVYSAQKWSNENYRTITFVESFEPTSNAAFYVWFRDNATKKPALEGTWLFNETPVIDGKWLMPSEVYFESDGIKSTNMWTGPETDPNDSDTDIWALSYTGAYPAYWVKYGWVKQAYRTITFTKPFEYSSNPTFYDWFIENAVKQSPSTATLAATDGWYKGEADKSVITALSIVDSYVPSGAETEVWDASAGGDGSVMAYLNGTELTLAGNGEGHIEANEDSSYAFADFSSVTSVQGLDLLDTSKVTDMTGMFQNSFTSDTNFVAAGTEGIASFEVSPAYVVSTLPIDLRSWDVSGVTSMSNMFSGVSATSINITGWDYENLENADGIFNGCADVRVIYLGDFDVGYGCSTEGIFDGTLAGKTGPTVYVASTDVKNTLVSRNDLQENTDEMWDDNLNPSQIVVNASAGRSSNTQVMMLIPNRTELYEYAA